MFKQAPLPSKPTRSQPMDKTTQRQMKLAIGDAKPLLKKSELEPISTEVTVKCCSSVGVGWELYSSSLITTLNRGG